ncbi:TRAP transporter substrate-binding protein [Pseudoroseomonas cervicalis]|uniref:Tat pathway signal sequence domain protein n=1 Tax=Pseudoroseomonas cervicalis ATCC 49957 TaxID=525371 RepID=D5RRR8_9PROT|nr:TRAP transporter substrate-binding protein [Pseudoroseomonas cervicalis]EFH10000.1 Tat pathway signal sequence domain protein [Pseudoroseomonas cervicalis ATCC 49957]
MVQRRHLLGLAPALAAGLAAPALLAPRAARADEVTLRLHHFLPAVSNVHRNFLLPWTRKVEEASQGRLKIRIFPAMQLGGAPPQLYDQARDGVADIVWTLPGYTAGRFPRIEVLELPFIANRSGLSNARATQAFAEKHLAQEFGEVQPLLFWAHDGGLIHSRNPVRRLEDMRGLKLRFPTRQAGEGLRALGAAPVGMPVPQVPEALSQGVLDGAVVPWEVVPSIKLQELVRNHTAFPGSPTFYVATNVLAMNKAKYQSLPADLRAVLDAQSGQAAAAMVGAMLDEQAVTVSDMARRRGNTLIELEAAEVERWREACRPVTEAWLSQMKERGADAAALLADAQALFRQYAA